MKKIILVTLCLAIFVSINGFSQTAAPDAVAKIDTVAAKEYVGKYKMKGAPFENVFVTIAGGKMMGEAEGQGTAELAPTKDVDVFEIVGYGGTVLFLRDENKKIKGCQLTMQGSTLEGEKLL